MDRLLFRFLPHFWWLRPDVMFHWFLPWPRVQRFPLNHWHLMLPAEWLPWHKLSWFLVLLVGYLRGQHLPRK